jgi:hypothetical protein
MQTTRKERAVTGPQEQLTELTRRTQEGFKHLWQQWSEKSSELLKGMTSRSHASVGGGDPEAVLDAVFDFAEHLIAQQRIFAKQMLAAASKSTPTVEPPASATSTATPTGGTSPASGSDATTGPGATTPPA